MTAFKIQRNGRAGSLRQEKRVIQYILQERKPEVNKEFQIHFFLSRACQAPLALWGCLGIWSG